MEVYVTKEVSKRAAKGGISDAALSKAVADAEAGLVDATLGNGIIKQRIPGASSGKSRGSRAIIFYVRGKRAIFLHLFAKSAKANLSAAEEEAYRDFAKELARLTDVQFRMLLEKQDWRRIGYEEHRKEVSERRASIASSGGRGSGSRRRDQPGDKTSFRRGLPDDG